MANPIGHFKTITKHRHAVIRHCFKAGILWRGLLHDLSKYSPAEFIAGAKFPMQMQAERVAQDIVKALKQRKRIVTIDWRYRLLVFFWRMIPRWLWVRLKVASK